MNTTTPRLIVLAAALSFAQADAVQRIHELGGQLVLLRNLPHRALGLLYLAHVAMPDRADYAAAYLEAAQDAYTGERLIEGQTRPVVAIAAVKAWARWPDDARVAACRARARLSHAAP